MIRGVRVVLLFKYEWLSVLNDDSRVLLSREGNRKVIGTMNEEG